jgi:tRNA 2-thiouridine synthesizing protein A
MSSTDRATKKEPVELLDTLGLKCPLPALKTRRALAKLAVGTLLEVAADDPLAAIDIPHLVRELGDELVAAAEESGRMRFTIRRRGGRRALQ